MNKIFEKKVDYANEPEAPMLLGMKILKKIEKDWGRDSDVYYEIEDVLIDLGSDSPKRLALALKRELTNYDMWHAPYKGLVNKIEKWVKPNGKVNESYEVRSDEEYLDKFLSICEEYGENKITLYFEDVDSYMIEKRFGDRFKKYLKVHRDEDIDYKAVFHTKNSGYGNRNVCVLYAVEYGGYGYSSTPLCELSFEEFDRLLRNFTFNGGMYRRNDTFMYESYNYNSSAEYDEVYDSFYNAIDDFLKDETLTESDLYLMVKDGVHYDDLKPFIIYSLGMMVEYLSEEDEEFYRGVLEDAVNDYYYNEFRIEEALDKPLFRTPTRLVNTYRDEVFNILDRLLDEGEIGYEDLENICYEENIYDEIIDYILKETSYGDTDGYRYNILKIVKTYYNIALANHLEDINESEENDEETPKKKNNKTKGRPGNLSGGDYRSEKKEKPKKSGKGKAALAAVAAGGIYTLKKAGDVLVKSFQ